MEENIGFLSIAISVQTAAGKGEAGLVRPSRGSNISGAQGKGGLPRWGLHQQSHCGQGRCSVVPLPWCDAAYRAAEAFAITTY